jgi:hypothetical protein
MFRDVKLETKVLAFGEWEVLTSVTLRWRAGSQSGKLSLSELTEDNQSPLPE